MAYWSHLQARSPDFILIGLIYKVIVQDMHGSLVRGRGERLLPLTAFILSTHRGREREREERERIPTLCYLQCTIHCGVREGKK